MTGTLIRGVAPAGTNVVGVSEEQVQASGATTVTELLTKVPQFSEFNSLQATTSAGNAITTNRPNLRGLPGQTTSGTSATLLLVDGHRVVGMGIASTTPDADFLPPGIIERVEIVPDGGSALYGSDAVAGVVNFVTMKRFDGVRVDARYGLGDSFHTFDANATVGKDWGSGSAWVSYNYTENGGLLGRDRDYNFTPETLAPGTNTVIRSLACAQPNISVSATPGGPATLYSSLSPSAAGKANICDISDSGGFYPEQKRQSVYAGLDQRLNDWLEVNVQAFYYQKNVTLDLGELPGFAVNLGPSFLAPFGFISSPYDVNLTGSPLETKVVNFTFGDRVRPQKRTKLHAWGFANTFTADVGGSWQLRARAGYSESRTVSHSPQGNLGALRSLVSTGVINPFAPLSASDAALAQFYSDEDYGEADQRQFNVRAIADGNLFALPGGMVKTAIGAEFTQEAYDVRKGQTNSATVLSLPMVRQSRNIKSVFGEVVAPIFGGDGGLSLTLSASGRYDHYSDVGDTFNPKFGATFKPIDWIRIRGAWGKSFVAPSLADFAVADPADARFISGATVSFLAPAAILAANGYPAVGANQNILIIIGSSPGLRPQKATTWSFGADITPPFVPGLRLSSTYYNITYTDIITQVPFINQQLYYSTYAPTTFTVNPTLAQIQTVLAQDPDGANPGPCVPLPTCVYAIQDVRKQNLSGFKQSGIDFSADYVTQTGFGSVDFFLGGTYLLTRKGAPAATAPYVSELDAFQSRLKLRSSVGANIGRLRAQATWNFSQGFDVPPAGLVQQTKVSDFHTVDLFLRYEFGGDGVSKDFEVNLTATNVFDQNPPLYYGGNIVPSAAGYLNGNTLGRLVQLGFKKKF